MDVQDVINVFKKSVAKNGRDALIEFDDRFSQWGPYDYVSNHQFEHNGDRVTIAELAASTGNLASIGQYWWHDPHYVSKWNT